MLKLFIIIVLVQTLQINSSINNFNSLSTQIIGKSNLRILDDKFESNEVESTSTGAVKSDDDGENEEDENEETLITKYDSEELNSYHLTHSDSFNTLYRSKCSHHHYCDTCCSGKFYEMRCHTKHGCHDFEKDSSNLVLIAVIAYTAALIGLASFLGILYFFRSKDTKSSTTAKKNGLYVFVMVLSVGTIFPGIGLFIYKYFTNKTITELFDADFSNNKEKIVQVYTPKNEIKDNYNYNLEDINADADVVKYDDCKLDSSPRISNNYVSNNFIYPLSKKSSSTSTVSNQEIKPLDEKARVVPFKGSFNEIKNNESKKSDLQPAPFQANHENILVISSSSSGYSTPKVNKEQIKK